MKRHQTNGRQLSPLSPSISPRRQQRQLPSQLQKPPKQQQEQKKRIENRKGCITPAGSALQESPNRLVPSLSSSVVQSPNEEYNAASLHLSFNTDRLSAASFSQIASLRATRDASTNLSESVERDASVLEEGDTSISVFGYCITDEVLREYTGWEDLHLVLSAEFRVDATSMTGVDTMGERMPMLESLKLNNSRVPQLRLLGTRFMNLKWLWLGNSRLENLRGIGACTPALKELYVPFNFIHDISPLLDLCETLELIDLEGNMIGDSLMLNRVLPLLSHVKYLTLQGNPVMFAPSTASIVCETLNGGKEKYIETDPLIAPAAGFRAFVQILMPELEYLDDIHISSQPSQTKDTSNSTQSTQQSPRQGKPTTGSRSSIYTDPLDTALSDEYMFLQECIRDCGFDALDLAVSDNTKAVFSRPSTSCAGARRREASSARGSVRPQSSLAGGSAAEADRRCPAGPDGRVGAAIGSSFSSALTAGGALSGPAVGLRRRLPPLPLPPLAAAPCRGGHSPTPERPSVPTQPATAVEKHAPLFDDEDDHEWEALSRKTSYRLDGISKTLDAWTRYSGINESGVPLSEECESSRKNSCPSSPTARAVSLSNSPVASPDPCSKGQSVRGRSCDRAYLANNDEVPWRRELVRCVAQTRSKTARVAYISDFFTFGNEDAPDVAPLDTVKVNRKD